MEKIWTGRPWFHPTTGEKRRYIPMETWTELAGIEIDYYNSGNISFAAYKGEPFANSRAAALRAAKVWVDEDDQVHVDHWDSCLHGRVDLNAVKWDLQEAWDAQK